MDIQTLRDRIERLDPTVHRALREALAAEYRRRTGEDCLERLQLDDGPDAFEQAFREAAHDLGERYIRGTSDYIRIHHPDLYQRTENADRRMNEVWAAGRQGRASIEDFRAVLRDWYGLHRKQIDTFAEEQTIGKARSDSVCGEG